MSAQDFDAANAAPGQPAESPGPAASPGVLASVARNFTEGPNIEASPWELSAARGETPLEGPRADLDLQAFEVAYDDWKDATQQFEQAVREMHAGTAGGREKAQALAKRVAVLHHRFIESTQPFFKASAHKGTPGWEP
ncbi:hypothetical protein [Variovorax sp. RCC_210]|jgi:hypothetical protein|uniref:hypothetical protein n=1 Tax=Variovorax sp. RCC_210 TaxID=3239217 RepID=UPI000D5FD043